MNLRELKTIIDDLDENYHRPLEDIQVCIPVTRTYLSIGPSHMVPVTSASMGFDWNAGRFWIESDIRLTDGK